MNIQLTALPSEWLTAALWVVLPLLIWLWLRKELTPRQVMSIFETDGTLSARQILAWVVGLFGLCMRAAGRLDNAGLETCLEWAVFLFGIGGVVKAMAAVRPATTVNAKKLDAKVETEKVSFNTNESE